MKKAVVRIIFVLLISFFSLAPPALASDHADPMNLKRLESGINDLFVFPDGDRMVAVLTVRRALTQSPPLKLEPYTYTINMDLHSQVSYESAEDRGRFGGTIANPEGISPDVTIELQLNNDTTVKSQSIAGLMNPDDVEIWTGVRDDPFIFPNFFGTNVVAMVLSIPIESFPEGQQDWLIWATSHKGKKQIDHVGRSNRTMLPRLDVLNTIPPNEQVSTIKQIHIDPNLIQDIGRTVIQPLFGIRAYDFVPDVIVYTTRSVAGFPNGRRLSDDVAKLTCEYGDCLLYQLSFNSTGPRPTTNDKPFLSKFPYLAEPWPDKEPAPGPSLTTKNKIFLALIAIGVIVLFIVENLVVAQIYYLKRRIKG